MCSLWEIFPLERECIENAKKVVEIQWPFCLFFFSLANTRKRNNFALVATRRSACFLYLYSCSGSFAVKPLRHKPSFRRCGHQNAAQQHDAHHTDNDRFGATRYYHRHCAERVFWVGGWWDCRGVGGAIGRWVMCVWMVRRMCAFFTRWCIGCLCVRPKNTTLGSRYFANVRDVGGGRRNEWCVMFTLRPRLSTVIDVRWFWRCTLGDRRPEAGRWLCVRVTFSFRRFVGCQVVGFVGFGDGFGFQLLWLLLLLLLLLLFGNSIFAFSSSLLSQRVRRCPVDVVRLMRFTTVTFIVEMCEACRLHLLQTHTRAYEVRTHKLTYNMLNEWRIYM